MFLILLFGWQFISPTPQINVSNNALKHFLVLSSAKDSLRSAKNVVFSLFCILVGSPLARPPTPPNKRFKLGFKAFFSLIQCKKRVLEVLKTWYFPYSAFWSGVQWRSYSPSPHPPPPPPPPPPLPGYATAYATASISAFFVLITSKCLVKKETKLDSHAHI